ncbi:MAG: ferrous iron transport protein A [Campylobacterales bacterium]
MNLTEVKYGQEYTIEKVKAEEPLKSRLLSFGFAKGNRVVVTEYTLTKQTYDVKVEDSQVALRSEEAMSILVEESK